MNNLIKSIIVATILAVLLTLIFYFTIFQQKQSTQGWVSAVVVSSPISVIFGIICHFSLETYQNRYQTVNGDLIY